MSESAPGRREPDYVRIARMLRMQIEAGTLRDGEMMPPGRVLAPQLGVSEFTVGKAMEVLASEGLVVSKARANRVVNYPQAAQRRHARPDKPRVVLLGGFPGSGKTEAGRMLARLTGWAMLDKDTLTRPVVESALELIGHSPHDRESPDYFEKIRPREYESLIAAALENVDCGNSCILTAPFIREFADDAWTTRTAATFEARNAEVSFAWIYCDAETMHFYMRQRGAARDASKLADWNAYLSSIDLATRPPKPFTELDNSASAAPLQGQVQDMATALLRDRVQ